MDEDIAALFNEFGIEIINGTLFGATDNHYADCFAGSFVTKLHIGLVSLVFPILSIIALLTNILSFVPLLRLAQHYFPLYTYLVILSSLHVITCSYRLVLWLEKSSFDRQLIENWRNNSLTACQLSFYIRDVIEQLESWLFISVIIIAYRMKVIMVTIAV